MRRAAVSLCCLWCVSGVAGSQGQTLAPTQTAIAYRLFSDGRAWSEVRATFSPHQLAIVEKLNRADRGHLGQLRERVVPDRWVGDELAYSAMPARYPSGLLYGKLLVVHVPGQMFGAYELGTLVRWGPVSSGMQASATPAGLYFLNWKSEGHRSSVNPEWFMRWYFNVDSRVGVAFHAYSLPGGPASHGCIRLLERDASWLFDWGDGWELAPSGKEVLRRGTPVFVVGTYDFTSPPPWRSIEWLSQPVDLPTLPLLEKGT